ncbi:MAG: DUF6326 family protein [Candidatus Nanopelagicales bacterium]
MTTRTAQPRALEERRIPVQGKLAAAWASLMFFYIYVDYLALYKPGYLDEISGGTVHGFATGPLFIGASLTLVGIPALMILLSTMLPARVNRALNLVVATLYIPVTVFNASGEPWSYAYFYGFSIVVEVLILVVVLRTAWTWPRTTTPDVSVRVPTGAAAR